MVGRVFFLRKMNLRLDPCDGFRIQGSDFIRPEAIMPKVFHLSDDNCHNIFNMSSKFLTLLRTIGNKFID
jgi:hypothetical protein